MLQVLWLIAASAVFGSASICLKNCTCRLDYYGRRKVSCVAGGMTAIAVDRIDLNTEIIEISAPDDNLNSLTIGPIFQQFSKLEEIHITKSNVPNIGQHSFWGTKNLEVLNLTQNNISVVLDHNFRGLVNLRQLYLDDNKIESLPSGTLRYMTELQILSLRRNRISTLQTRVFLSLGKLRELRLSGNPLLELTPEVFKDVQELRVLECRACGLRIVNPHVYHLLPQLQELDLGNNEIRYLDTEEFVDLKKLVRVWLDGNQLPVILERAFANSPKLRLVNLARNRLAKVTDSAFYNLTFLEQLDLSYNKLDHLSAETLRPSSVSLTHLNLSGNYIPMSELRYVLQEVLNLTELSLTNMGLHELPPGLFTRHESLSTLRLDGNIFDYVPIQALPPHLNELTFARNRLRGLEERDLARIQWIPVLDLRFNPWTCDQCHIMPLVSRMNKTNVNAAFRGLKCKHPPSLEGRTLQSLGKHELNACTNEVIIAELEPGVSHTFFLNEENRLGIIAAASALLLLVVSVVAISVGLCLSKRHAANYYTNEEKRAEQEMIFDRPPSLFGENGEINFQFPYNTEKIPIATIDEIKRDSLLLAIPNGT